MPNFITDDTCLLLRPFMSNYTSSVCVLKSTAPAGNWTQDFPLTGWMLYQLNYQLNDQCSQCPNILFVSDGLSPNSWVATPSNTQHTIFALFWAPQSSTCCQLLCLLVIVFFTLTCTSSLRGVKFPLFHLFILFLDICSLFRTRVLWSCCNGQVQDSFCPVYVLLWNSTFAVWVEFSHRSCLATHRKILTWRLPGSHCQVPSGLPYLCQILKRKPLIPIPKCKPPHVQITCIHGYMSFIQPQFSDIWILCI